MLHRIAKPFLKWVGGKTQLLSEIRSYYPSDVNKYCEPFVGGGATLFDLIDKVNPETILINDINPELINCYRHIKNRHIDVIRLLSQIQSEFLSKNTLKRKEYFDLKRNRFNELILAKENSIEKASLMIFLNKICFNGLYRVNKQGLFNVPCGSYVNPLICNEDNIKAVHKALKNVQICCDSYLSTESFIDDKTFVYIDPPYRPIKKTSSFTGYSKNGFNDKDQIELSQFISRIQKKGAKILLSNSDPKNENKNDVFFDELYQNYKIKRVKAARMINSNKNHRGRIKELIITNI